MRSPIFSPRTVVLVTVLVVLCGFLMVARTEAGQKVSPPNSPTVVDSTGRVVGPVIGPTSPLEAPGLFEAVVLVRIGESVTTVRVTPSEITGFLPYQTGTWVAFSGLNCTGTAYLYYQRLSGGPATFGGVAIVYGENLFIAKPVDAYVPNPPLQSRLAPANPSVCENDYFGGTLYVEALTVSIAKVNEPFEPPFSIAGVRTLP